MSILDLEWVVDAILLDAARPVTRGDCIDGPRPCPWASCRHHLLVSSVSARGELRGAAAEIEDLRASCSLDCADAGPMTSRAVGAHLGITFGRVQQIEEIAMRKMERRLDRDMVFGFTPVPESSNEETLGDIIDRDFKAAVDRAYQRIVPEAERGAKAIRVAKNRGGR